MKQQPQQIAWCYANGKLIFSETMPEGTLFILPELAGSQHYRSIACSLCRLAHDNKTLLVPGLPENPGDVIALRDFSLELAGSIMLAEQNAPTPGFHIPDTFFFWSEFPKPHRR